MHVPAPDFDPALRAPVRRGGGRGDWCDGRLDAERTRFITGDGMTETAGYVTALDWRDAAAERATGIGTPLPGVELRSVAADGRAVAAGETGEARVRYPGHFSGYHQQPPRAGLDADRFFCTGDLGAIDADGGPGGEVSEVSRLSWHPRGGASRPTAPDRRAAPARAERSAPSGARAPLMRSGMLCDGGGAGCAWRAEVLAVRCQAGAGTRSTVNRPSCMPMIRVPLGYSPGRRSGER